MALGLAILTCALATGTCHAAADPGVASFAVRVQAPAATVVQLRALDVPRGWIASFCTPRVCSPNHVALPLRGNGSATIQVSYVRTAPGPAALHMLHIAADADGAHADVRRPASR